MSNGDSKFMFFGFEEVTDVCPDIRSSLGNSVPSFIKRIWKTLLGDLHLCFECGSLHRLDSIILRDKK